MEAAAGLRRLIFSFAANGEARALAGYADRARPDGAAAAREGSMSALVDRRWLREEAFQDVIADHVVLLVKRGMRDAGHDGELLVGVGQPLEELQEVGQARDAVVLAAHDEGRHRDFLGIADRQIGAHVDIGAGRHAMGALLSRVLVERP